jgi:hypothetical protein
MANKIPIRSGVRIRAYPIIEKAVEAGAQRGWHRVWKHVTKPKKMPTDETVVAEITSAIMLELSELFEFDGEEA